MCSSQEVLDYEQNHWKMWWFYWFEHYFIYYIEIKREHVLHVSAKLASRQHKTKEADDPSSPLSLYRIKYKIVHIFTARYSLGLLKLRNKKKIENPRHKANYCWTLSNTTFDERIKKRSKTSEAK